MTKIAFTSGMLVQRFDSQPVWQRIQAQDPDYLVLLGNAIHLDIDVAVQPMSAGEFAEHAHALYRAQLAVPEFDALLRHMAAKGGQRVFSIWNDHDFLWRDAAGADIDRDPDLRRKIAPSRALFRAFRQALMDVGSFPANLADITPPPEPDNAPLYESLPLADDLWLHLTDGRSRRTGTWLVPQGQRALLGAPQLDDLATTLQAADASALHLVASAPTSADWKHHRRDWAALLALASRHRLLMLSGDLLCNDFASHVGPQGWPLHEATASGAALRDGISFGSEVENFALAEITGDDIQLRFFEQDGETAPRRIARAGWTVAAQ